MSEADALGPVDPDERVEVSLLLRPSQPLPDLDTPGAQAAAQPLSRAEYASRFGAAPADLEHVAAFAQRHGLEVLEASQARRTVRLAGSAAAMGSAFGVALVRRLQPDGRTYRVADGPVQLPPDLEPAVESVFGLDNRPVARRG